MRTACLVAALAACGSPPAPTIISNTSKPVAARGRPVVSGTITDPATQESLAGVTVVVNDQKDAIAITDEHGKYQIPLPQPGRYRVTIYYLELTLERDVDVSGPTVVDQELEQTHGATTVRCTGARATTCRRRP